MLRGKSVMKHNKLYIFIIITTSLCGGFIYLGVASLYQFVFIFISLLVIWSSGMKLKLPLNNVILKYMLFMLIEAGVSVIWAPDKGLALNYVYYVFLLFLYAFLFDNLLQQNDIEYVRSLMVILLFVLNIIGIWESITNNHLLSEYLDNPSRARMLAYVPGGFFMNPNDFATYIIQILPFSFIASIARNKKFRLIAIVNIFLSIYIIIKTESRTQILMMICLLVFFIIIAIEKKRAVRVILLALGGGIIILNLFPQFLDVLFQGLKSVSGNEIIASSEGGSLGERISLLKNGVIILFDTFGLGIGAGCHRVVMPQYSTEYYYTGNVAVMHNLLGEIFVDYGIFIGTFFVITLIQSIRKLYRISKMNSENEVTAKMFIATLCTFVICGIASSSIIQLTSIWTTFCYIGAFIRVLTERDNIAVV